MQVGEDQAACSYGATGSVVEARAPDLRSA